MGSIGRVYVARQAIMQRLALTWLVSIGVAACADSATHEKDELMFQCDVSGGQACPAGRDCPQMVLGSGGCGDLPSLCDHPTISIDGERSLGCVAKLPYENPFFPGAPQQCTCKPVLVPGSGPDTGAVATAHWECSL
jgi:hypothetical protein